MGKVLEVETVLQEVIYYGEDWEIHIHKNAKQKNTKVNYGTAKGMQIHWPLQEKMDGNVRTEQA
jgi:hypothetical protein